MCNNYASETFSTRSIYIYSTEGHRECGDGCFAPDRLQWVGNGLTLFTTDDYNSKVLSERGGAGQRVGYTKTGLRASPNRITQNHSTWVHPKTVKMVAHGTRRRRLRYMKMVLREPRAAGRRGLRFWSRITNPGAPDIFAARRIR